MIWAADFPLTFAINLSRLSRQMDTWQLQEAKNKFSELVARALSGRPQLVTRHGKKAVIISSAEDFESRQAGQPPEKNLIEFLLSMPKVEGDNEDLFVRTQGGKIRDVDFD